MHSGGFPQLVSDFLSSTGFGQSASTFRLQGAIEFHAEQCFSSGSTLQTATKHSHFRTCRGIASWQPGEICEGAGV